MNAEEMAHDALGQDIKNRLDNFMVRVLTLHDIGKALPHPYDAIGQYATGIAHDFAGLGYAIRNYIDLNGDFNE